MTDLNNMLRKASIANGHFMTDDEAVVCHKTESPSLHELELATHKHRWKEMQKVFDDFFNAFIDKVTEYEVDLLDVLNLPAINKVRQSAIEDDTDEGQGIFTISTAQIKEIEKIKKAWQEDLVGTKNAKDVEENEAIYAYYLLQAYSIGLNRAYQDARNAIPVGLPIEDYFANRPMPNLAGKIINRIYKQGNKRIIEKLEADFGALIKQLKILDRSSGPMKAARFLHKQVGEKKAWWWRRIARSESTLANNAAFQESAKAYQVPFQEWSAASNACVICQGFDGHTWPINEGPEPVNDSHPHCFVSGTSINTRYGDVPIQEVKKGDYVFDHLGKYEKVTKIHRHVEQNQRMIRLRSKSGDILYLTNDHPVLINIKNECGFHPYVSKWIKAGCLNVGDIVYKVHEKSEFVLEEVSNIVAYIEPKIELYNLSVENGESYVANHFVVHNCACVLRTIYIPEERVQESWNRESPYNNPYTPEELADIAARLR